MYISEFGGVLLHFIFHFHVFFRLGVQPPDFGPDTEPAALVLPEHAPSSPPGGHS